MHSALQGIRVLELDNGMTQYAGKMLADMGADVIKVEPLSGAPARRIGPFYHDDPDINQSLHFWHYNTSKRSITIDLSKSDGQDIFRRLAHKSDIILDGLGPQLMESYQLDYANLSTQIPSLIYCQVTPFGSDGPWASLKNSDLVHLALGGPMGACGYDDILDAPPIAPTGGQSAHITSTMAAVSILSALHYRELTGEGQFLDVAVHDAIAVSTEMHIPFWEHQHINVKRNTGRHAMPHHTPPWVHHCRDGKYLLALPLYMTDDRFSALVEWFDSRGMAEDLKDEKYRREEDRSPKMHHVTEVIGRFCAKHDSNYMFHEGQKRKLAWGPVNSPDELYSVPHLKDREFFVDVKHDELGETFQYPGAPYKFMGTKWQISKRPPLLGEHSLDILNEVGIFDGELCLLRELGVV
jgi:crotonobetainyl-CoA:carnitine CoA-transferase CaiB-like acyl-CoA transferase